jgi:hypothetical protein
MSAAFSSWLRFASLDAFSLSLFMFTMSMSNSSLEWKRWKAWSEDLRQPTGAEELRRSRGGIYGPELS